MVATKSYCPGADFDIPTVDAQHELGERISGNEDSAWIYVQADAGGITGEGYVVLIDESFSADMIDTTNSATARGQRVGVAKAAFTASYYGWVQVKGVCNLRGAASAAANAALNTTATAGQVDDDGTTGAEAIEDMYFTTAVGGSAGNAEAILNDPVVGATL